ncbi:MAG: hypothetical protein IPM92_10130 [Saprospiraceae bacterium]|nr:hypothetical protein [Saprospiraceae bacterium]
MPRISITVKNALVYFVLLVLTSATLGFAIYKLSSKKVMENTLVTLIHNNESAVLKFNSFLDDVRKDVWYLSKNPFLKDFFGNEANIKLKEKLAYEFLALLSAKNQYAQIRFIGLANKGKELIRVEQFNDKSFVVADSLLQTKGDRDYFRETIQLPEDSIYFSQINLNQEYGKILLPVVPTLRVATPMFHNGRIWGIVIINVDLTYLFRELEKVTGQFNQLKLINPDGYYLIHPDTSMVFQFEFDQLPNIAISDVRQNWSSTPLLASQYQAYIDKNAGESIIEFNYPRKNYPLYFTLSSVQENLLGVFNKWKLNIIYITLLFILASIFIAIYWTRRQAKQFSEITKSITAFGNNPNIVNLNIDRNDEIGDLAKSFQEMSSRIHHYVNELMLAKNQADEANKAKQEFIENMSHEMRNPLQSILGMVNMLEQNQPRDDQDAFIRNLKFSADHLLTLVNDVLDYRKLLNDQINLNPKDIQIQDYLDKIMKGHLFEASQKKIKLNLDIENRLNKEYFVADPVRLSQILNNLLSNAIRYSPANHEVRLRVQSLNQNQLWFEISDQGPGMSDENIYNVLQLKPVTGKSRQIQNVGLGLPIAIRMLGLMKTKLEITRNVPTGLCFGFHLPTQFKKATAQDKVISQSTGQLKQLIYSCACIDDDPQNIFYYQHIFEKIGVTVDLYTSPESFLQTGKKYYLILSDVNFTESHFSVFIDQVKLQLEKDGILVIISAIDDTNSVAKVFEGKIDCFLQKPVTPDQLLSTVERAIYHRYFEMPALDQLSEQYDGDSTKSEQALELLLREWKDLSSKMDQAIKDRNNEEYERIVHRLANSMRLLNLFSLEKAMNDLKTQLTLKTDSIENDQSKVIFGFQYCIELFQEKVNSR